MVVGSRGSVAAVLIAASSVFAAGGAIAQTVEEPPSLADAFQEAFYTRGGNFFENREFPRSLTWFAGPFPENDITADAEAVHELYLDALEQQNSAGPVIRTADLENPFSTSLLTLPPTEEIEYSAPAPAPVIVLPPEARPAPAPAPQRPIPALW